MGLFITLRDLKKELQSDPLEKEMATHSSIHVWSILWTEDDSNFQFSVPIVQC